MNVSWISGYLILKDYYEKFHKFPKINEIYKNFQIFNWIKFQRKQHTMKQLSKEQINLLNEININWYLSNTQFEKLNNNSKNKKLTNESDDEIDDERDDENDDKNDDENDDERDDENENDDDDESENDDDRDDESENESEENEIENNNKKNIDENLWIIKYNKFKEYVKKNKKLPTSSCQKSIYTWYIRQKTHYKNNVLEQKYIDLLNKVYKNWYDYNGKKRI